MVRKPHSAWALAAAVSMLLMAVAVPASGQAEPRLATRTLTVPAAAFNPTVNSTEYANTGRSLFMMSGTGRFTAPVFFGRPTVKVTKLTIYGYDNNSSADVCISMYVTRPKELGAPENQMGRVCTSGATTLDPRWLWTAAISPNGVSPTTGPYLWLELNGAGDLSFYAVSITYQY